METNSNEKMNSTTTTMIKNLDTNSSENQEKTTTATPDVSFQTYKPKLNRNRKRRKPNDEKEDGELDDEADDIANKSMTNDYEEEEENTLNCEQEVTSKKGSDFSQQCQTSQSNHDDANVMNRASDLIIQTSMCSNQNPRIKPTPTTLEEQLNQEDIEYDYDDEDDEDDDYFSTHKRLKIDEGYGVNEDAKPNDSNLNIITINKESEPEKIALDDDNNKKSPSASSEISNKSTEINTDIKPIDNKNGDQENILIQAIKKESSLNNLGKKAFNFIMGFLFEL